MKSFTFAGAVFIALVLIGIAISWQLMTRLEPKPQDPADSRVVATQDLPGLTLLTSNHLEVHAVTGQNTPKIEDFIDRYLLVEVKKGGEVKDEMLAVREATPVLSDATLVSITASATTSLGGQLSVGELVDLVAIPSLPGTTGKKFEKLVVLSSTQPTKDGTSPATIMLAVPSVKFDEFASAIAGSQLLISRKIVVK